MEVCPAGFFCFDRNTFILIIVILIIFVVYKIYTSHNAINHENKVLNENTNIIKNIEKKLNQKINNIEDITIENNLIEDKNVINYNRVHNPLTPPLRSNPVKIVPINIPTRGYVPNFQQVGILIQDAAENKILPLFGKPTYPGSRQWLYYTMSDNFASVKLPVTNKNKSCQDTYGCDEIMEDDTVTVDAYKGANKTFKANIYKLDQPRYIPYI